jgi:hypothetical protein
LPHSPVRVPPVVERHAPIYTVSAPRAPRRLIGAKAAVGHRRVVEEGGRRGRRRICLLLVGGDVWVREAAQATHAPHVQRHHHIHREAASRHAAYLGSAPSVPPPHPHPWHDRTIDSAVARTYAPAWSGRRTPAGAAPQPTQSGAPWVLSTRSGAGRAQTGWLDWIDRDLYIRKQGCYMVGLSGDWTPFIVFDSTRLQSQ